VTRIVRIAPLAVVAALVACGSEERAAIDEQPPDCVEGLQQASSTFGPGDLRVGEAMLINLRAHQRMRWVELYDRKEKMGRVKLPIVLPAGGTLVLSVPPEARGIIALFYDLEGERPTRVVDGAQNVTLSACRGRYPSVGIPGQLLVARPVCRVPLDWRYGSERGRLHLSFGDAC
jgi:hypothetical protein